MKGVDHDLKSIGGAGVEILPQLVDDDLAGLGVFGEHPDVECGVVVEQLDFGVERGRLTFARVVLHEVFGNRRPGPRGLVQPAIEDDGALRLAGGEAPIAASGVVVDAAVLRGLRGRAGRRLSVGRSRESNHGHREETSESRAHRSFT